jgi:hypothetical protein
MARKQIGAIAIMAIAVFVGSAIAVGLMPVWVIVLMVRPKIMDPLAQRATQAMMRQGVKSMVKRSATQPMTKL